MDAPRIDLILKLPELRLRRGADPPDLGLGVDDGVPHVRIASVRLGPYDDDDS